MDFPFNDEKTAPESSRDRCTNVDYTKQNILEVICARPLETTCLVCVWPVTLLVQRNAMAKVRRDA